MIIYLIRHTKVNVDKSICYGQTDVGLASTFENEVETIFLKLPKNLDEFKLFSSPLKRCKKLAERFGQPVLLDRLKEINFGNWEMQSWNNIPKEEIDQWNNNILFFEPPDGENFRSLIDRVLSIFAELKNQHENKIIVSHSMPIRIIISNMLGIPYENIFRLKLSYGSVIKLNIDKDFMTIEFL